MYVLLNYVRQAVENVVLPIQIHLEFHQPPLNPFSAEG